MLYQIISDQGIIINVVRLEIGKHRRLRKDSFKTQQKEKKTQNLEKHTSKEKAKFRN